MHIHVCTYYLRMTYDVYVCVPDYQEGLFCSLVGLFCLTIGLFCLLVGLFCLTIGLFCSLVNSVQLDGSLRYASISRSLLPYNRSLLPYNRSLLPYNRYLFAL